MCGRYQRRSDKQRIAEVFALDQAQGLALPSDLDLTPNYNVAPQTMQPVILWDERFGTRAMRMMFWRFLPPFCSDPKAFRLATVNASSDSIMKGIWKESFLRRRCLVPVDTFIEWRTEGGRKLPWVFAMKDDSLFALGGIWRRWRDIDTFAIITVEPNELVAETTGHDRMPLVVPPSEWRRWLEPGPEGQPPADLLRPFEAAEMKAWRSDPGINSVRRNGPELGRPLDESEPPTLFS
jgi:putative SOS response-associated peptidase YedK